MSPDKSPTPQEDALRLAIRHFTAEIDSGRSGSADTAPLVHATVSLPVTHFVHWEQVLRDELVDALRLPTPPWWKAWGGQRRFLTWIDLVSWDGYVRERVLRTLSGPVRDAIDLDLVGALGGRGQAGSGNPPGASEG